MSASKNVAVKGWSSVVAIAVSVALVGCGAEMDGERDGLGEAVQERPQSVQQPLGPGLPLLTVQLENLVPVSDLSDFVGSEKHYRFVVPPGQRHPVFKLSGGLGNADLYVKYNEKPSLTNWDCKGESATNEESCVFSPPDHASGIWYVMVLARENYEGATLHAEYSLNDGVPVEGLSSSRGKEKYFKFSPEAQQTVMVSALLSGGTGDADIYVRRGALPTLSDYDCSSAGPVIGEYCDTLSLSDGPYYVMVYANSDYSGVALKVYTTTENLR